MPLLKAILSDFNNTTRKKKFFFFLGEEKRSLRSKNLVHFKMINYLSLLDDYDFIVYLLERADIFFHFKSSDKW